MTTHRDIVSALARCASEGDSAVLATVVRITGSSYGGVGSRMVICLDGSTVGIVSGGCLESDLALHAQRVHASGRAEIVSYDTRGDDSAPWGLGLGCNGLIDVLLEPLSPSAAHDVAELIDRALEADSPSVIATVIRAGDSGSGCPTIGSHASFGGHARLIGEWPEAVLAAAALVVPEAFAAGRRGLVSEIGDTEVAFEVVNPAVRLIICGAGPDAAPVARFASELGWAVTVVDHRRVSDTQRAHFPNTRIVECREALDLASAVLLSRRAAAVVMSHHFERDRDYLRALLESPVGYIGMLGPRARTDRVMAEFAGHGHHAQRDQRIFSPIGMDIGGEGPDAIALSIVSQISAVMNDRDGGHLRDRRAPLHSASPTARVGYRELAKVD